MPSLNYKHLLYFWTVAREGSITRASEVLHVTQPAISAQLTKFEDRLGEKLFSRSGRNLVLTEAGRVAFGYAEEIFALGRELEDTLQGRLAGRPLRLAVGISNALPKLLAFRLVSPALRMRTPVQLVVHDDRPERLLADLGIHALDLVLTDSPLPPTVNVRAYNHLLGECGITVFAAAARAEALQGEFPHSLDGAPFLLPTANTTLRRSLEQWFDSNGIRPLIAAEIEDSAVLKAFGEAGVGLFAAPTAVEAEIRRQYRVRVLGRIDAIRERFYAISVERRIKHPAVAAISEAARGQVFGGDDSAC
jgi:LysR family transcriptional regulator, transcriptional activator of nhaA